MAARQQAGSSQAGPKTVLVAIICGGIGLILFSLWTIYADVTQSHYSYRGYRAEFIMPYPWYVGLGCLVGGAVVIWLGLWYWSYRYHQVVGSATVRGTSYATGLHGSANYYLVVEGYNRVGQLIQEHLWVQPRRYYNAQIGESTTVRT
jgi:hypothetical protein